MKTIPLCNTFSSMLPMIMAPSDTAQLREPFEILQIWRDFTRIEYCPRDVDQLDLVLRSPHVDNKMLMSANCQGLKAGTEYQISSC